MAESIVTTTQRSRNQESVQTITDGDKTTTITRNQNSNVNESVTQTKSPYEGDCPCGRFNLDKLADETLACSLQSSNIMLAQSNAIVVFTMIILQEVLITICKSDNFKIDNVFLITSALASLGDGLQINNPPPFNS